MHQTTTPKSIGINYAQLRKQKQDTIPRSQSGKLFSNKYRSTSQYEMAEIQLFESQEKKIQNNEFLLFLNRQLNYLQQFQQHSTPFRINSKNIQDEKKKLQNEANKQNSEYNHLIKEVKELNKINKTLSIQCEMLSKLVLKEKFDSQSRMKEIIPQETISSLADERFDSQQTSLDSSLSEDDYDQQPQLIDILQRNAKHRFNFTKQLI